jgi:hypothetical protein
VGKSEEIDTIDTAEEFSKEVGKARLSMYVKTLSIAQNMLKKLLKAFSQYQ